MSLNTCCFAALDATEIGVIAGGVILIGLLLWYFFGPK